MRYIKILVNHKHEKVGAYKSNSQNEILSPVKKKPLTVLENDLKNS